MGTHHAFYSLRPPPGVFIEFRLQMMSQVQHLALCLSAEPDADDYLRTGRDLLGLLPQEKTILYGRAVSVIHTVPSNGRFYLNCGYEPLKTCPGNVPLLFSRGCASPRSVCVDIDGGVCGQFVAVRFLRSA